MALERLGPYRIERQIGHGGMGTVYAAVNVETGQTAAVKVLSSLLGQNENFRARFEAEIESLKRLKHPNIVQLVGFGEHEGHLFYAMELVNGASLHDVLRSGRRFAWQEVIRLGISIASALKLAHDSGIIHRDIKPANLMLTQDGQIKLMDFGIARLFGSSQLTADGGVVGTVDYMAPEQAEAQPITPRTDLYSLGAVFFALLTGRPPFTGKSVTQILLSLRHDQPLPVQRLAPDTPDELCVLIDQLLEKDPKKRIPTALILTNRLKAIEHGLNRSATTSDDSAAAEPTPSADQDGEYRLADDPLGKSGQPPPTRTLGGRDLPTQSAGNRPPSATVVPNTVASDAAAGNLAMSWGDLTHAVPGPERADSSRSNVADLRNRPTQTDDPDPRRAAAASHFTTIDEDERRRVRRHHEEVAEHRRTASLQVAGVVLAVLLLTFGLWYLNRPASADKLFTRIATVAANSDLDALEDRESDIDDFLEHYAEDPRAAEVRSWKERVVAHRETRKLARRVKWSEPVDSLATCERLYASAAQLAATDPETALARFRSLVDVFGNIPQPDEPTARALKLARQQIVQLAALVQRQQDEDRNLLGQRLDWADEHRQSDADAARRIYAGIITLYGDTPWAAELVERARKGSAGFGVPRAE